MEMAFLLPPFHHFHHFYHFQRSTCWLRQKRSNGHGTMFQRPRNNISRSEKQCVLLHQVFFTTTRFVEDPRVLAVISRIKRNFVVFLSLFCRFSVAFRHFSVDFRHFCHISTTSTTYPPPFPPLSNYLLARCLSIKVVEVVDFSKKNFWEWLKDAESVISK